MRTLIALLIAISGCAATTPSQPSPEEVQLQNAAEAFANRSAEDVPYGIQCQMYGDCAYCEDVTGPNLPYGCSKVCYSWACASGDKGANCYEDCSLKAEE